MGEVFRGEALILRTVRYRDADVLMTVLGEDDRPYEMMARNAAKSRKRFPGGLQLLSRVRLEARCGRGRWNLEQSEVREARLRLREELSSYALACYAAERALEGQGGTGLFRLVDGFLSFLDREGFVRDTVLLKASFDLALLRTFGLGADLRRCAVCGASLRGKEARVDEEGGEGLVCKKHALAGGGGAISTGAVSILGALQQPGETLLGRLRPTARQRREVHGAVEALLRAHLSPAARSGTLLESYLRRDLTAGS